MPVSISGQSAVYTIVQPLQPVVVKQEINVESASQTSLPGSQLASQSEDDLNSDRLAKARQRWTSEEDLALQQLVNGRSHEEVNIAQFWLNLFTTGAAYNLRNWVGYNVTEPEVWRKSLRIQKVPEKLFE